MSIADTIKNFFFPNRCPFCNKVIEEKEIVCKDCIKKFPINYFDGFAIGGFRCISPFYYEDDFRKGMLNFKFYDKKYLGKPMGILMVDTIKKSYGDLHFDIITAVPLHNKRLKERGYNQSEILARTIAEELNIPYIETLFKHKNNKVQHTLKGKERMNNVKNAYKVIDKSLIKDKNILIVDDIITTGCTIGECAKTLFKGGCNTVCCCTLCKA